MTAILSSQEQYTPGAYWCQSLAKFAQALVTTLGEGDALDLIEDVATEDGWSPELAYLTLRVLKPNAPIGQERAA